jgi:hypothetical protein
MVHTDGEPLAPPKGAMVIVLRGAEHTLWDAKRAVTRMVGVFAPSRFEHYFEELAQEIDKHRASASLGDREPIREVRLRAVDLTTASTLSRSANAVHRSIGASRRVDAPDLRLWALRDEPPTPSL